MEQKLKSQLTQEIIVKTSFDLFYKKGYHNTTIPEIMKATQLSKGAFYHHFKNKRDIGEKVISMIVSKRIHDGMILPLKDYSEEDIIKLLMKVFKDRLNSFSKVEKKYGCPANNLINEIGQTEEDYRVLLREIIDQWKDTLIEVIKHGQQTNEIRRELNPTATAIFLISAFEGVRGIRKVYDDDDVLTNYLTAIQSYIRQLATSEI